MKHITQISLEFIKTARQWNEMNQDEQKRYLSQHPNSIKTVSAPATGSSETAYKVRKRTKPQVTKRRKKQLRRKLPTRPSLRDTTKKVVQPIIEKLLKEKVNNLHNKIDNKQYKLKSANFSTTSRFQRIRQMS